MRSILICPITAVTAVTGLAQSPVKVVKQSQPEKALIFEVSVPAMRSEVWKAFATGEGLSTWLSPGAVTELKKGGERTAHVPGGKTGGGNIVDFVPEKELDRMCLAPDQFPHVRAARTKCRFEFKDSGDGTIVRLTQTGWQQGEEWDKAYEYLAGGNAELLEMLRQRFVSGPIDWAKLFAAGKE